MDESLLPKNEEQKFVINYKECVEELKKVSYIAAPMVVVTISNFLLFVVPLMMVGHLGELALSSIAVATSIANVTGYSVLVSAWNGWWTTDFMWTAYGAKQYKKLGISQDPLISIEAAKYTIWLIPSLFPYAILESIINFLQAQSLILPMLFCSVITLCLHITLCWVLIFKFEFETKGGALAITISYWINVIFLGLYLKYSSACAKTRTSFSKDVFGRIREFLHFAFPSAGMICLEWWSIEVVVLLSGLLPNPKLQSSVLSICFNMNSLQFLVAYSIRAAASTRVSNELGVGNSRAATLVVYTVIVLATLESITLGIIFFYFRSIVGYAFSNDYEVVNYLKEMIPIVCVSIVIDSLKAVLSGVAQGTGWQHIGAYTNFGAYYLFGIPLSIFFGFAKRLSGMGLWAGLVMGSTAQVIIYSFVTGSISWEKQANKAKERIFQEGLPDEDELLS